jgi:hypothetical protein
MPSIDVGAEVLRNRASNSWPCARSLIHSPDADPLPGRNRRGLADDGHQITMSAGLRLESAEAVLAIVEGDPLDEAHKDFLGRCSDVGFIRMASTFVLPPVEARRSRIKWTEYGGWSVKRRLSRRQRD